MTKVVLTSAFMLFLVGASNAQTKVDPSFRGTTTSAEQDASVTSATFKREEEALIAALKPKLQQQVVTVDGRTYLDVAGKVRLGKITLVDPNTAPKDDAAAFVDIEVGTWQKQSLYVRALMPAQPSFVDPPPTETTPVDVDLLRAAIGVADPRIQQCKDGTCKKYCKRDGVWKCCEYGCS